jgi:outer membrane protein assembly factor BamB
VGASVHPEDSSSAAGAPSVANGALYVAPSDATSAVDAATGTQRWAARLNAFVGGAPPVIDGDAIVVADTAGRYRLEAATATGSGTSP